jgi:hypothetical protein
MNVEVFSPFAIFLRIVAAVKSPLSGIHLGFQHAERCRRTAARKSRPLGKSKLCSTLGVTLTLSLYIRTFMIIRLDRIQGIALLKPTGTCINETGARIQTKIFAK